MPRSVPEWIGSSPDAKVPDRVKVRVFQKHNGRCYLTGVLLRPGHWELEHIIALINGGEHRERNLAPVDAGAVHQAKTAEDVAIKAKTYARAKKAMGLGKAKRPMPGSRNSQWKKPVVGPAVRRD